MKDFAIYQLCIDVTISLRGLHSRPCPDRLVPESPPYVSPHSSSVPYALADSESSASLQDLEAARASILAIADAAVADVRDVEAVVVMSMSALVSELDPQPDSASVARPKILPRLPRPTVELVMRMKSGKKVEGDLAGVAKLVSGQGNHWRLA